MLAEAVRPFPASVEITALVVLFCAPVLVAVTSTVKVHEALAARVAPDTLTLPDPAAAVIVPPPQLPVKPLGVETVSPAGSVSVKPIPLRERAELGFDRLKVSDVLPFNGTLTAPNIFAMVGGNLVGGGGPPEPPPQATFQRRPVTMKRRSDTRRNATRDLRVISTSFYWSFSGTSSVCWLGWPACP